MEGRLRHGYWLLIYILLGCGRLSAFNLDTENVLKKTGEDGSLFGFSLAMHRQLQPVDKTILLVGAPTAKALTGQKSKVTGGLYSCDMTSPDAGCRRLIFDDGEDLKKESKENQWMGVSVSSQGPGGKVMTCAHRYEQRSNVDRPDLESRVITGRCFVFSQDLTVDRTSNEDGDNWHFCQGRRKGHEMFGSCQQGVAAIFDNDYRYFIFGAPGAYNWKGIVRVEQKNLTFYELGIFDDGPFETGDENLQNPKLVPAPPNSYLGFSLDSGRGLTKNDQLTVVAGAPRANHSGAVVLLKKGPEASKVLVEEYTLEGEGLASSFGYDLTVVDYNADGWKDIVVGAPQFFVKDGEIGGAIYIYINKNGKWNDVTPTRIDGSKDSMFGLAVENLGDINQDGFQDFAVGAPYENNGAGAVYIYHGSATAPTPNTKASQVLSGQPMVKLFGYSLAGKMDLDKNSYPDLAVGSLSDAVFVYRARPVISVEKEITFSPNEINLAESNCDKGFCFEVKACFAYTAKPKTYSPKLTLAYVFVVDSDARSKGLKPRAIFADTSNCVSNYNCTGSITLSTQGKKECATGKLTMQENIRDKLNGIPLDVSLSIQDAKRRRRQSSAGELTPVLDEKKSTRAKMGFLKTGCGLDNKCESNLQLKYRYGYKATNDETFTEMKQEDEVPVFSISNQKDIALEVTVTNPGGEDAYEASLTTRIPKTLTYSAFRVLNKESLVTCSANVNGSQVDCELGNPFSRNSESTFYILLSTGGISTDTSEVEVELTLHTTSTQTIKTVLAKAKVAITLQLSLFGQADPSQVDFSGEVKGESAMITENDIGSAITHKFNIINRGKSLSNIGTATLEIDWPKGTENEKWLLYLVSISGKGVDKNLKCTPSEEINPQNKAIDKTRKQRAAGNNQGAFQGTLSRLLDNKKIKSLSCEEGAKCVRIKCPLEGLDDNAVITLHSRLWNSTFLEDYSDFHHVEVVVKAFLKVNSALKNVEVGDAMAKVSLTAFPERRADAFGGGVPWWIIVLSILFGLLLLALLAFLLWKCGFFERANFEDKVPSYNAVRITREEKVKSYEIRSRENPGRKSWMTTWEDNGRYS